MKNLTIINKDGQLVTDSREVSQMVDRPHNDLMKSIRTYIEYLGQGDFAQSDFFISSTYINSQNKEQPCYLLTRKGCDMVANKMTGEKGVLFTAAYVTKFEEMEKKLQPKLPQSYAEALRELAAAVEERELLQEQNKLMAPKAEFFDQVADSKDAIEMKNVAKVLNIPKLGRNKIFEILRGKKILMKDNTPYQVYCDKGYFRVVEQKYSVDGEIRISFKTLVYQKGLDYIRKILV